MYRRCKRRNRCIETSTYSQQLKWPHVSFLFFVRACVCAEVFLFFFFFSVFLVEHIVGVDLTLFYGQFYRTIYNCLGIFKALKSRRRRRKYYVCLKELLGGPCRATGAAASPSPSLILSSFISSSQPSVH